MKKSKKQLPVFTLQGSYYSFIPIIIPGLLVFIISQGTGGIHISFRIIIGLFYVTLLTIIFFIKPQVTITNSTIITKWFRCDNILNPALIKKIVFVNPNSIHIYKKNKKLPIQLSMLYGFKANLLFSRLKAFAKRNQIHLEQRANVNK